ncbi:MAG: hypothetical protein ACRD3B_15320 [Candidatus Sulfotelmatobacter sp.]
MATSSAQTSTASDYLPTPQTALALPGSRARALRACVLAVLVASVLMALGLNFFVGILGVGFVAVFFYRQKLPGTAIKTATGAVLGALSGFLCVSLNLLLSAVATMFPEIRAKLYQQILENAQKIAAAHPDIPQLQVSLTQLKDPQTFIVAMVLAAFVLLVCSMILGSLGGMLGTLLFRGRERS